ncbi:MAG: 2-keto-4-pentenoate hydratase [Hyphomicrobiaceae bacterium]|jgi:2-keto-4-pentenoate hydratase
MSEAFDTKLFATRLIAAHHSHVPVSADDIGAGPQSPQEAFAVQAAVMRELGANGGFKTGRPDPAKPSIMAPVPARFVRQSPANYEAAEMRRYGIEIEIAFRIDSAVPALGDANYDAQLRAAVSAVAAIEMVDSRLADLEGATPLIKLADNQSGFGLVIGQPVKDFSSLNLTNPAITFTVNGVQTGPTDGQIPGTVDAFQVLKDFHEVVGDHCGGLQPGMYVTTGALSGLFWIDKGARIEGSIAGLGDVTSTIGD